MFLLVSTKIGRVSRHAFPKQSKLETSTQAWSPHGPKTVTILGPEETTGQIHTSAQLYLAARKLNNTSTSLRYVYPDRPQYLLCLTSPFFDRATVKWYGLLNVTGQWQELTVLDTFTRQLEHDHINYVLGSIVQLVSTNTDHAPLQWISVKCVVEPSYKGLSDENETAHMDQIELQNYEPPGKPSVSGYGQTSLFPEGANITLTCEAEAGTPPGKLVWLSNPEHLEQVQISGHPTTQLEASANRMRSQLELTLNRELNGLSLRCASVNDGYNISDGQTSIPVLLSVAYTATGINMTASDESGRPLYPRATNPHSLKSTSDQTVTLDTHHNPPAITADSGIEDSSESKTGVRSHVVLTLNWSNHGDLIECFVRPTAAYDVAVAESVDELSDNQGNPAQSLLTRRMLLNVRFKPVFLRPAAHLKWPFEQLQAENLAYGLPQFVAVEGGSAELDLEPLANPPVEKLVWLRNDKVLNPKPVDSEKSYDNHQVSVHRTFVHSSTLRIQPVEIADMGNYSLVASNNMGFTRFQFFLNVTYGPQLIGDSTINITASGQVAQLECRARANPTPTENAVRWRRLSHSFSGLESIGHFYQQSKPQGDKNRKSEMEESQADSISGIRCNKGKWHKGFKYFAKCWSPTPGILVSSLTIYDLGPSDVGRYQCYMDNAVGSPAVRLVDLIYPFSPRVIPIPRWSRAAPGYTTRLPKRQPNVQEDNNFNSSDLYKPQARLTCVVGAEPKPSIEWTREPANLTLVEGGQFRSELRPVRPGLYHAVLYLNQPRDSDLGRYFCKATNLVGQGVGHVDLVATTRPDQPSQPRLVNATSSSLAVSWTQEFSGGPPQKFQLRWAPNDHPEDYKQTEVGEDVDSETVTYNIL
ncbi:uncharacterized protein DEA37_0010805, partial [Paragonimus westermani]